MVGDTIFSILGSIAIIAVYIGTYKFLMTLTLFAGYSSHLSLALAFICFIHVYKN